MRFEDALACIAAFLFAALAPGLILLAFGESSGLLVLAFWVSLAHALVLGLPLFLIFRRKKWVTPLGCIGGGAIAGMLPTGLAAFPGGIDRSFNAWNQHGPTIVNGVATFRGWLEYLFVAGMVGAIGAFAGFVFWFALRLSGTRLDPGDNLTQREGGTAPWYRSASAKLLTIALVMTATVAAMPIVTKDRSCHNMFRDGRNSVGPKLNIELMIEPEEWPHVREFLKRFAASQSLSMRGDDVIDRGAVKFLEISLCNEAGLNVRASADRWAPHTRLPATKERGVSVSVFALHAETEWRPTARRLVAELNAVWPEVMRFRGPDGLVHTTPYVRLNED